MIFKLSQKKGGLIPPVTEYCRSFTQKDPVLNTEKELLHNIIAGKKRDQNKTQ